VKIYFKNLSIFTKSGQMFLYFSMLCFHSDLCIMKLDDTVVLMCSGLILDFCTCSSYFIIIFFCC